MNFGPYDMLIDFAIMSALLFIAQLLRTKIQLIQNLYLPSSLMAGLLGLLLGPQLLGVLPFSAQASNYPFLLVVVLFATLFIGKTEKTSLKRIFNEVGDTFALNLAAEFGGFGIALLLGGALLFALFPGINYAFPLLLPAGFVGGHGYAAAIGGTLKSAMGWSEAITIGQTFATLGLLSGIFGGLIMVNWAVRARATRFVKTIGELPASMRTGLIPEGEQPAMGKETINPMCLDPLAWHALLVLMATAGGYYGVELFKKIIPGVTLPMMSASMLAGVVLQFALTLLGLGKHVDKRVITRIGSSVSDYLVAFGVATIKISIVAQYAIPIAILSALGIAWGAFLVLVVGRRLFHNFWFERSIFIYGWATGVVATGVTLLRIVDPEFRSRTLEDYGAAYVVISIIELFLVSALPLYVANGHGVASGVVLMAMCVGLWLFTASKYGLKRGKVHELRPGEHEAIGMP